MHLLYIPWYSAIVVTGFFDNNSYCSAFLQPSIQVYGVEGRYATALFSAASKQKNLDKVEQELGRVAVSFPLNFTLCFCLLYTVLQ